MDGCTSLVFISQAGTGNQDLGVIRAQVGIENAVEAAKACGGECTEKKRQESLGPRNPGLPGWAEEAESTKEMEKRWDKKQRADENGCL